MRLYSVDAGHAANPGILALNYDLFYATCTRTYLSRDSQPARLRRKEASAPWLSRRLFLFLQLLLLHYLFLFFLHLHRLFFFLTLS